MVDPERCSVAVLVRIARVGVDAAVGAAHNRAMNTRRSAVGAIFVPILIGCVGLAHVASTPRFASYRAVDVLQFVASGVCFGVALTALLTFMGRRA